VLVVPLGRELDGMSARRLTRENLNMIGASRLTGESHRPCAGMMVKLVGFSNGRRGGAAEGSIRRRTRKVMCSPAACSSSCRGWQAAAPEWCERSERRAPASTFLLTSSRTASTLMAAPRKLRTCVNDGALAHHTTRVRLSKIAHVRQRRCPSAPCDIGQPR